MRAPLRLLLVLLPLGGTGCPATSPTSDASVDLRGADASASAPTGIDVTGRYAGELSLSMSMGSGDGGTAFPLRFVWAAYQRLDRGVETSWLLCDLPLPGLVDVPTQVLNNYPAKSTHGAVAPGTDAASFAQPPIALVVGARLADPVNDPLPTDGNTPCSDTVKTGCVVPDAITRFPGVAVAVRGLVPNVEFIYVDVRVRFGLDATARADGTVNGDVLAPSVEAHVLACQYPDGHACTKDEVAGFEAAHAPIALSATGAKFRSHIQGGYFTCPQFLDNPEGALRGIEVQDGGVPDMPLHGMSFEGQIQADVDERGCATGGCHEIAGGTRMHLVFRPDTDEQRRQNWRAILPYTRGPQPGGLFVNQTPLPAALRARWLRWIADGSVY